MTDPGPNSPVEQALARGDADGLAAALATDPADGGYFAALTRHGRTGRAIELLRLGLTISPGVAPLSLRLGNLVFGMEDFDRCATLLLRAALIAASDKAMQNRAVAALFQIENLVRAEHLARHCVTLDPDDPEAWFWLGRVLRAGGRHEEARAALAESARRDQVFAIRSRIVEQGVGPADFVTMGDDHGPA